jgi:site-specific DNA-methyltransferase (adenine-specific)
MSIMDEPKEILEKARELAGSCHTWADLSNALFDPVEGLVVRTFRAREERAKFRKTEVYDELHAIVEKKMKETGVVRGATPKKSGKFVVRLPRSLHAALESEAETEGTSLNQLVVTKLAVQLDKLAGDRIEKIMQAFLEVREGYSADKVIADPDADRKFLRRCRELGLAGTDYELNWKLMNARKAKKLSGLSELIKTKRYTVGKVIDEFEYASELAVRYMQQSKNVSVDQIICDPELAEEFDTYAAQLAPDFSRLQYRWAAFGLRKGGRLGKKVDQIGQLPELETFGRVTGIELGKIPEVCGLYLFSSSDRAVFASQTDNLRHRLERHIKVSSSGLPSWLWDVRREPLQLGLAPLPGIVRSVRQKMEVILVKRRKPLLNLSRVA